MAIEYKRRDITVDEYHRYARSRELAYGNSFAFAALPDLTLSADLFLNGAST